MKIPSRVTASYREIARMLVAGDGSPRTPASIAVEVERALLAAYGAGQLNAWPTAREAALREVRSAVEGLRQGLASVERTIDKTLQELGTVSE